MKQQSAWKKLGHRNLLLILITFVVALITLTMTSSGSVFPSSSAKTLERQTTAQESKQTDVRELRLGSPIERELAGGDAHSYSVMLTEEQYLHVVVEQEGIDVVIRLFAPAGQMITEVDRWLDTQGTERVSAITEAAGEYRLEVRSLAKGTPIGRYRIRIEELREATPKDKTSVAAERAYVEGNRLRVEGSAESLKKAIEKLNDALILSRAIGDRESEANTLNDIELVYLDSGDLQKALEFNRQQLQVWQSLGNHVDEQAVTLNNLGIVYFKLGDLQTAIKYFDQTQTLIQNPERPSVRFLKATVLNSLGVTYLTLGDEHRALDYLSQALDIYRNLGERTEEARILRNMGSAYMSLGDFQKALENFHSILEMRQLLDRRLVAYTFQSLGYVYSELGEAQKALGYLNQALDLRRATGDRYGEADTLTELGLTYRGTGELQTAIDYLNQSLTILHIVGDRRGEARTLNALGRCFRDQGEPQKAMDYHTQALALQRASGNRRGEIYSLSNIGDTYASLGQPQKALEYLTQALELNRARRDQYTEALILRAMARIQRDLGKLIEARAQIEAALNITESIRGKITNQDLRTSYLASKQDFYKFYIDLLMQMHRSQSSAGHDAAALQVNERARARSLLEILTEARADIRQGVNPVLLERERSSQQQLNVKAQRLTTLLGGKHSEEQATAARKEVEVLLADYQDVEAQIRAKSPRYAALTQPRPLSVKEIQQVLDKETLLLEYALGEERSYLWAVTPTSVTSFELPKRAEIEAAATQVYEALTARNKLVRFEKPENKQARVAQADADFFAASAVLSQMLLGPVAGRLGRKRLLIVSEGALQYVPFGALPIPGGQLLGSKNNQGREISNYRPLITEHEILSLPSASTLAVLRKELVGRPRGAKTVAVLADPVFQDDDPRVRRDSARTDNQAGEPSSRSAETPGLESEMQRSARDTGEVEFRRLPFSRQEADGIAALTSTAMRKESLGFEASLSTATSADLSNYRIIHFATHGFLNSQHPELSGIVLSLVDEAGRPQDGFLRLNEIYNLKLNADLMVLSACRTALGKEIKGEGLVGLTRGFMYAGAPRVVASLWAVDDETSAELMKKFYREMLVKKQRPAAALRAAQVSIWNERRLPPYYWAAFILQGEWK